MGLSIFKIFILLKNQFSAQLTENAKKSKLSVILSCDVYLVQDHHIIPLQSRVVDHLTQQHPLGEEQHPRGTCLGLVKPGLVGNL